MSSNMDEIKRLLNLDKQDKESDELMRLDILLADNAFLNQLKQEDPAEFRKILYNASFESFAPKQIIQALGTYAKHFYVILDGQVDVLIKSKKEKEESLYGARQLKKGDCFNDLAMLTDQKSPLQYQACDGQEHVSVLVVSKKDFNSFSPLLSVWLDMHVSYLKNLPVFWNQTEKQIQMIHLLIIKEKVEAGRAVFLEGDKSSLVYIVRSGEFAVYKYFQDLQLRKLTDVANNKSSCENNVSAKCFRLQEFDANKNIKARVLKPNEMSGEEDIIAKRNRSFSLVCESPDAEVFVLTQPVFKILMMGEESTRNFILSRLKVKDSELTKILNKQACQVSSARIHILGKDQLKIATTPDFVKTRSFQNKTQVIFGNSNGKGYSMNGLSLSQTGKLILNESINNSALDSTTNNKLSLPLIGKKGHFTPSTISEYPYASANNHHFSTKRMQQSRYQPPPAVGVKNLFFNEPATFKKNISSHLSSSTQNYDDLRLMNAAPASLNNYNNSLDQTKTIGLSQSVFEPNYQDDKSKTTPKNNNNNNTIVSIGNQEIQLTSTSDVESGNAAALSQRNSQIIAGQANSKRDSKFFDNFTRNSVLYYQKYQINKEKRAIFGVGKTKIDQNDEALDTKGKQLSDQIQQYISRYEHPQNSIMRFSSSSPPPTEAEQEASITIPQKVKILYRKPFSDAYYAELEKKEELERQLRENPPPINHSRNFKINFYQSRQ